jgi:lipopolysaccharide/colanic/teichoic acid biosynthesis glycosyltransferase
MGQIGDGLREGRIPEKTNIKIYAKNCAGNIDSTNCTLAQQQFYHELEAAVREYVWDLHDIVEMADVKPSKWYLMIKRTMDIFVGVLGMILLSPLFLVVAILIKIDSRGPVFFNQERVGKDGRLFEIHKFRTMVVDAERKTGPVWAVEDDPRLTFVGRFLRKSKIDEFPQFLNLLKGEMTMVGPRPERPFFVNHFVQRIPGYDRRLDVTPGITGLAQLTNGYDQCAADVIHKLQSDISYIRQMGLPMDLKLLGKTFLAVLIGRL